jgi:flagellin-like protein
LTKAQAEVIGYVILIGFAVILAVIVGKTIIDMSKESSTNIKQYLYNTEECKLAEIGINNACQTPQALNIEIENKGTIEINGLMFKFYDVSGEAETKKLEVPKSRMAVTTEIVPTLEQEKYIIVCNEKSIKADHIQDCS